MDLVLDALVEPDGTWRSKERADFDEALHRGLVTPGEAVEVWAEADRVQAELKQRKGPFAPTWDSWAPPG
jgi:predicted RNA-binding protein associated with RNAse of E/G family